MTENELTDLGFNKVEVNDLESQNGYDYYYYTLDIFNNLTLISVDNDRVQDENWYVYNLDWPDQFKLQTVDQVQHFLQSVGHFSSRA
jgi:hypothetical protein